MKYNLKSTAVLNNKTTMPWFGLGTFLSEAGKITQDAVRWALQNEIVVIPKSIRKERIIENADIFDFEIFAADMSVINAVDENCSITPALWDPETSDKWK
jgi:diketogulonate reductase-like aldo/keto reductase